MDSKQSTFWLDTPAGKEFQSRLSDEKTLEALNQVLDRVETLERAVANLTAAIERSPKFLEAASHVSEEAMQRVGHNGYPLEQRMRNALHLAERLTAPETVARIDQLIESSEMAPDIVRMLEAVARDVMDRIPPEGLQLDERIEAMTTLAGRLTDPKRVQQLHAALDILDMAPDLIKTMGGMAQDLAGQLSPESLRLDERLRALLPLLDRLTAPETLEQFHQWLARTDMAPDLIHTLRGVAEDALAQLPEEGLRIDERVQAVMPLLQKLTEPETAEIFREMLALTDGLPDLIKKGKELGEQQLAKARECGFDPDAMTHLITATGGAFCEASREEYNPMGLGGMMRAPFDKDRQVAIGFLMSFLKKLGQRLRAK